MMFETEIAKAVVDLTLKHLSKRHSVEIPHVLDDRVCEQYTKAIRVAFTAFERRLSEDVSLDDRAYARLKSYLESEPVTEEVSKLLDPGFEFLDRGCLVAELQDALGPELADSTADAAWGEFLKAFSFASRSLPELREFLRASYEAGSFSAISNISDALSRLGNEIDLVRGQESTLRTKISDYLQDLTRYGEWARRYSYNH